MKTIHEEIAELVVKHLRENKIAIMDISINWIDSYDEKGRYYPIIATIDIRSTAKGIG